MSNKNCPNCGSPISADELTCNACGFLVAQETEIKKIDEYILKIEQNIQNFNSITTVKTYDIMLIFFTVFFIYPSVLFYFPFFIELILIFLFIRNKRAKNLTFNYFSEKDKFDKDYTEFSSLYPKNKKLQELKSDFDVKISVNLKTLKKNIIISSVVTGLLFVITTSLFFSHKSANKKTYFSNEILNVQTIQTDIIADSTGFFNLFSNNFYIDFHANDVYDKNTYVQVSHKNIIVEIDNKVFDYNNTLSFELSYVDEENNKLGLTFNSKISLDTITKSSTGKTMINVYFLNKYNLNIEQANKFYENVLWQKYFVNLKIN